MAATAAIPNTPVTQFFSHRYPAGFKNIFMPIKEAFILFGTNARGTTLITEIFLFLSHVMH